MLRDVYVVDLYPLADGAPANIREDLYAERYLTETFDSCLVLERDELVELTRSLLAYTVEHGLLSPGLSLHPILPDSRCGSLD